MGYRKEPTHYKLVFKGEEYEGLEVTAKSLSVGTYLKLTEAATAAAKGDASQVKELFEILGSALVSWNLEDDKGKPVKANVAGLMDQEMDFVNSILEAWMTAMAGLDPNSLATSRASLNLGSLPMEAL